MSRHLLYFSVFDHGDHGLFSPALRCGRQGSIIPPSARYFMPLARWGLKPLKNSFKNKLFEKCHGR